MSALQTTNFNFSDKDLEDLVMGGEKVLGKSRFFFKLNWKETSEDYRERLRLVTYRNHCKQVLSNYEAYIISDESIMIDDTVNVEQRVRSILQMTNMLGACWVLGLKDSIETFRPVDVERKETTIILNKPEAKTAYELDVKTKTLTKKVQDDVVETQESFNLNLLRVFSFNDGNVSLIADVAPQSVEINNLRSVVTTQGYKTLKDWRFGPQPEDDEKVDPKSSEYIAMLEGENAIAPGLLQYNPNNMTAVSELVQKRTLELATEVNLVEEFSTELKNVAESAVAKQVRRAALTASVKLMAKILQKEFNILQEARFDSYQVGALEDRQDVRLEGQETSAVQLGSIQPNFVVIKARVISADSQLPAVDFLRAINGIVKTEKVSKAIKGLLVTLLPLSEEKIADLVKDVEENSTLASDDNLLNAAFQDNI